MRKEAFNKLTHAEAERLALLLEELGEVQQAIGKILRHGYYNYNPDVPSNDNRTDLHKELGDVLAVIKIMLDKGDLKQNTLNLYRDSKLDRVWKYLHHNKHQT